MDVLKDIPQSLFISEQMLKRGFQFAPGYRLQEFLGRGQFGQVWRSTAPGGTAAAMKFIDLSDGQGQKEYEGVKRVKQIRHANLMPITAIWLLDGQGKVIEEAPDEAIETIDLAVGEQVGQSAQFRKPQIEPSWLVVSMLLGGKSLQQRLRECVDEGLAGIPCKELISYMDESAKAIDFLNAPQHDLGDGPVAIQHSDVKPANIVLIGSSAVVCDFGLARILSRNQVTATSAAGTPAYMAPEAIAGKPSRTCDQYSLAVTYYHLRTGTLPVNDGSLWEVLDAHRLGNLKLGLVSEAEQEVLRKATNLNWEHRFDSNVDMVDALREALRIEGRTKAGFVPPHAEPASTEMADAETKAVEADPTATLDTPASGIPADQSLQETAPFAQTLTPTDGFLKESMPGLQQRPGKSGSASDSFVESIKRNPITVVGILVGAVVVSLLAAMAFRPPEPNPLSVPNNRGGAATRPPPAEVDSSPLVNVDPSALVREAASLLDSDELTAITKFKSALELDPGLQWLEPFSMPGHKGPVMSMIESPDGSQLVTMADDSSPFLWSLVPSSGNPIASPVKLPGHTGVSSFAIDPTGERLLTGGFDPIARVWNLTASDVPSAWLELSGHQDEIAAVAWHPTESVAITASADRSLGVWKIALATKEEPNGTITHSRLFPIEGTPKSLASDPNGKWLAATVAADLVAPHLDVVVFPWEEVLSATDSSPPPIRIETENAKRIAFISGNDESLLVVGDYGGGISLHSIADDRTVKLANRNGSAHTADVEAIRVVHILRRDVIVTGSADGSVHWWKVGDTDESRKRSLGKGHPISCVDVSADGRWVAAGANDGSVWLWDTDAGKKLGAIQFDSGASSVDSILIDAKSKWLIAGCDDGVVRLWDLKLAKLLALTSPPWPEEKIHGPMKTIELNNSLTIR